MNTMSAPASTSSASRTSADEALDRFNTPQAAAKYTGGLTDTRSHEREMRCIRRGLRGVPVGSRVLDLPCGTGRLLPELSGMGYVVTEADSSPHMIDQARSFAAARGVKMPDDRFVVASVFETGFSADQFDATVCNRLFHHFFEADVRRNALRELRRITRGAIVVSFFSSRSMLGTLFGVRDRLRSKRATDRVPISPTTFALDAEAAGLKVTAWHATRPGVSKQCCAVMQRA